MGEVAKGYVDRERVVEEGSEAAGHLLTMSIRALDYSPPTDLQFCDYLSAFLTADMELVPDDSKYGYRDAVRQSFAAYGMKPESKAAGGVWERPEGELMYDRTHFEPMQRDPDEIFRFIWENRRTLGLYEEAYSFVQRCGWHCASGPMDFSCAKRSRNTFR